MEQKYRGRYMSIPHRAQFLFASQVSFLRYDYFDSCGAFKDAVIAIIAALAKQESVRISQRVRAGLDASHPL